MENYLIRKQGDNASTYAVHVKLTDFGLSCKYDEENPPTQYCGTLCYMAPEILLGREYDYKVDCFALGVSLYELVTDTTPFKSRNKDLCRENIMTKEVVFDSEQFPIWDKTDD